MKTSLCHTLIHRHIHHDIKFCLAIFPSMIKYQFNPFSMGMIVFPHPLINKPIRSSNSSKSFHSSILKQSNIMRSIHPNFLSLSIWDDINDLTLVNISCRIIDRSKSIRFSGCPLTHINRLCFHNQVSLV